MVEDTTTTSEFDDWRAFSKAVNERQGEAYSRKHIKSPSRRVVVEIHSVALQKAKENRQCFQITSLGPAMVYKRHDFSIHFENQVKDENSKQEIVEWIIAPYSGSFNLPTFEIISRSSSGVGIQEDFLRKFLAAHTKSVAVSIRLGLSIDGI